MSLYEYNQGFGNGAIAGRSAVAAAEREADSAIADWKAYSSKLKDRLAESEKKTVVKEAYLAGREAQYRALREALQQLDPSSPVLSELQRISGLAMAESFAQNGYHYDPEKELLRKA
jgi:hypothetical protein